VKSVVPYESVSHKLSNSGNLLSSFSFSHFGNYDKFNIRKEIDCTLTREESDKEMASKKLLEMLNMGIAREMQVAVQYMWQHVQWIGVKGYATKDAFKGIAITEMKHAESIAERLFYLGAIPTTKPDPIHVGKTLKEMITQDVKDEKNAIDLYKQVIELARKEADETTAFLFMEILKDEEDHHDTFTTLLEQV
jgi:bacterioferritin